MLVYPPAYRQVLKGLPAGLEPTKAWVKDLVDEIIAEEFASPDLELVWVAEAEDDLGKDEAALENRVKLGAFTLKELRDAGQCPASEVRQYRR